MTFIIIFVIVFIALGVFAIYLSRNIEHGEARFGPDGKMISDREPLQNEAPRPARRIEQADKTGDDQ